MTLYEIKQKYSPEQVLSMAKRTELQPKNIRTIATFFTKMNEGGTERVISFLVPIWLHAGYKVILFTDEPEAANDYVIPPAVKRVVLGNSISDEKKRFDILETMLKDLRIDVMVYHAWLSENLLWDMLLCRQCGVPFILYTHGVFSTIYYYRNSNTPIMHKICRLCDGVVSLTNVSHAYYSQLGCNSYLLCNPCDKALLEVSPSSLDKSTILWVGRFSVEKRPQDAVMILKEVVKELPDAKLVMLGDGSPIIKKEMEQMIKKFHLEKNIELKGFVQETDRDYKQAGVLLVTSEFEGFCFSLLEAQAYGIPVVMYDLSYLPTAKGSGGIKVVKQRAIEDAARNVLEILWNDELRVKLGREAKAHAEKLLQQDIGEQWRKVFNDLENKKPSTDEESWIDLLIEHEEIGMKHETAWVKDELRYRIGDCILKIPRKIKHLLKRHKA